MASVLTRPMFMTHVHGQCSVSRPIIHPTQFIHSLIHSTHHVMPMPGLQRLLPWMGWRNLQPKPSTPSQARRPIMLVVRASWRCWSCRSCLASSSRSKPTACSTCSRSSTTAWKRSGPAVVQCTTYLGHRHSCDGRAAGGQDGQTGGVVTSIGSSKTSQ